MKNFYLISMALAMVMAVADLNAASWHTSTRPLVKDRPPAKFHLSKPKSEYMRLDKYFPGSKMPGLLGVTFGEDATKSPDKFTPVPFAYESTEVRKRVFFERYTFNPEKPLLDAVRYECHASKKTHKIFRIVVIYPKSETRKAEGISEVSFMRKVFAKKFNKTPIKGGVCLYIEKDEVRAKKTNDEWKSSWYFVFPDRNGIKVQSGVRIVDRSLEFSDLNGLGYGSKFMYLTMNNFELEMLARKEDMDARSPGKVQQASKDAAKSAVDAL